MEYHKEIDFEGEPQKALELARAALTQSGYRITANSEQGFSAEHQGGFARSQSGSLIYGASPVIISISGHRLVIQADYRGADKAKRFILRLLVGLALFLGLVLGITFGLVFKEKWPMYLGVGLGVGIPLVQLPIHLLVTPGIIKRRATRALDTLMHNMVMVG